VARRCDNIAKAVGRPFLLENITYYLDPGGDLSEPEFFRYILDHSDALVLLDLTNLYTNSVNLGVNPSDYLEALPVDRVGQVHLAGGRWYGDTLIDSHEAEVPDPVWALLDQWRNAGLEAPCIIERDQAFPDDFEELLSDVARAAEMQSV
jgi:uncharacterized protein (UPF0276 family)